MCRLNRVAVSALKNGKRDILCDCMGNLDVDGAQSTQVIPPLNIFCLWVKARSSGPKK
jgi:hypothetical protein